MKILLVDDDEILSAVLTKSLAAYRYVVDTVKDGETGWVYGSTFEYDLIVLDIMLPKLDGISLCQRFRAEGYTTPILLLTSQDTSTAKVNGLDAGADDYVVKPFDGAELSARIRALLRRSNASPFPLLAWGDLVLNPSTCEVTYSDRPLTLTTKEYELLELLLRGIQHVFSTEEILDRLWSSEDFPSDATVRSHIRRLRHKLVAAGAPADLVATVHGRGYYLKAQDEGGDRSVPLTAAPRQTPAPRQIALTSPQAQYLEFLNQTWVTNQPKFLNQLSVFDQAIAALQLGSLSSPLRQQAHQTAHKLAGSLGTFGLTDAMILVRQLEQMFSDSAPIASPSAATLAALLSTLRQEIQTTTAIQTVPTALGRSRSSLSPEQEPQQSGQEPKIMIVDDDHHWLQTLPNLLNPWGFKITTLADPQQFWAVLQSVMPDLLVLDVKMPEVSGFELCQALRTAPHWQKLPVLFLSVLSDQTTQNQAFTFGADDYLCKPITGVDLANRIQSRLQRVRAWAT
jgi:DNA-binding response OmpR family regulator/HPt (histidine-containing phosphotransfer) domain-containing protein